MSSTGTPLNLNLFANGATGGRWTIHLTANKICYSLGLVNLLLATVAHRYYVFPVRVNDPAAGVGSHALTIGSPLDSPRQFHSERIHP